MYGEKIHVVEIPGAAKIGIEQVVKERGSLVIQTFNKDWDEQGNFIRENYAEEFRIAEEFVKKYNPGMLDETEYIAFVKRYGVEF